MNIRTGRSSSSKSNPQSLPQVSITSNQNDRGGSAEFNEYRLVTQMESMCRGLKDGGYVPPPPPYRSSPYPISHPYGQLYSYTFYTFTCLNRTEILLTKQKR
ncbi:hypothetical protein DICVIV_11492 [Dictyocaulus viviparus]|uniref:Uncharacterized protein n=1 Tax=Dictyocaulus viviparus TaxID=29172 RepID=A0A0D8XFM9_DICVI|nr:hypothetical protein DICVIV_11492 [Dictyocaulus viviparus]